MGEQSPAAGADRLEFLDFYDRAVGPVYGYLSARSGSAALAEDLTAETFLAAVDRVRGRSDGPLTVPWIMGVARHKLVDHWRRQARDERRHLRLVAEAPRGPGEPWEVELDALRVRETLEGMPAAQRAALTLRYLDDLPVPEIADLLGRTIHATEALLVRARAGFRVRYSGEETPDA